MKNRKILNFIIIPFIGLIIFSSCQYETLHLSKCTNVSFTTDIQPIFEDKCKTCHASENLDLSTGNSYNSLINGGYVDLDDPGESIIYTYAKASHNGATGEDACKILGWIEEGALDN